MITPSMSSRASKVGKLTLPNNPTLAAILNIVAGLEQGRLFPELIFVGTPGADPAQLVLVEGHKSATAYVYADKPAEIQALVGFSPGISNWYWF